MALDPADGRGSRGSARRHDDAQPLARSGTGGTLSRRWRLGLAAAAVAHVLVVADILWQPLDHAHGPDEVPTRRSMIWPLSFDSVNAPGPGADFFAVYHAGVQVARGESPYARAERPLSTPYSFIYRYPPIVAHTLGRLAASLPPRTAYVSWVLVVELTLGLLIARVWRQQLPPPYLVLAVVLLLLNTPYLLELHMGQFTFFAAAVTGLVLMALQANPVRATAGLLAALPLTAVAVLKQFPLMVVPALVGSRAGRAAAAVAIACSALLLTPLLLDDATRDEFVRLNLLDDTAGLYPGNFGLMYQVFATAVFLGLPLNAAVWGRMVGIAGLAIFAIVAVLVWRSGSGDMRRTGGTLVAAFFLTYFRVWEHHYSAVLVAGTLVLASVAEDGDVGAPARRGLLVAALLLLAAPTVYALLPADPKQWSVAQHYLLAWPKIAGTCAVVVAGLQAPRGAAARASAT